MNRPGHGLTAIVLGGYGGFGARLSRRLVADGWRVIVAGRNLIKAQAFAATLANAEGMVADRNGDLMPILAQVRPALLVDTAGPFQGSNYAVPQACISAGVTYLDLADGRQFVCAIGALDPAAQAAGVAVVSGASSVPALSGAVVRELTPQFDSVDQIDLSISASDRATAGASVAASILGYAGKRLPLWDGAAWQRAIGWRNVRRERYRVGAGSELKRWVALVDVPDHVLLPKRVAGRPKVTFRAGPEFGFQLIGIWLLSWPVQWGWLRSLVPLAPMLHRLQRLTAWLCSDRSAMAVTLRGQKDGVPLVARWTLVADQGDGPEIPVLAAQLLARRLAAGDLASGARDAGELLALADFQSLFAELVIGEGTTTST
jgi:NAD(P)-dependent dehydrogenase (short-subunit alcohol dehydrogenase family)